MAPRPAPQVDDEWKTVSSDKDEWKTVSGPEPKSTWQTLKDAATTSIPQALSNTFGDSRHVPTAREHYEAAKKQFRGDPVTGFIEKIPGGKYVTAAADSLGGLAADTADTLMTPAGAAIGALGAYGGPVLRRGIQAAVGASQVPEAIKRSGEFAQNPSPETFGPAFAQAAAASGPLLPLVGEMPQAGRRIAEVAKQPGSGNIAFGTGQVLGGTALLIKNPTSYGELGGAYTVHRGVKNLEKGISERKAYKNELAQKNAAQKSQEARDLAIWSSQENPASPLWKGTPEAQSQAPDWASIPATRTLSGRVPGPAPERPVAPQSIRSAPAWANLPDAIQKAQETDFVPPTELPSGRVPGPAPVVEPPPSSPRRAPAWADIPDKMEGESVLTESIKPKELPWDLRNRERGPVTLPEPKPAVLESATPKRSKDAMIRDLSNKINEATGSTAPPERIGAVDIPDSELQYGPQGEPTKASVKEAQTKAARTRWGKSAGSYILSKGMDPATADWGTIAKELGLRDASPDKIAAALAHIKSLSGTQ